MTCFSLQGLGIIRRLSTICLRLWLVQNDSAKWTQAAKGLACLARFVALLTATPYRWDRRGDDDDDDDDDAGVVVVVDDVMVTTTTTMMMVLMMVMVMMMMMPPTAARSRRRCWGCWASSARLPPR
jgi:hypothetical protein